MPGGTSIGPNVPPSSITSVQIGSLDGTPWTSSGVIDTIDPVTNGPSSIVPRTPGDPTTPESSSPLVPPLVPASSLLVVVSLEPIAIPVDPPPLPEPDTSATT